ncbi:MAG: hypothetical protein N2690_01520 [Rhodocyclaceae bacterium]|nr:hypothetical protein [Rhodocyclaceae bacterium]
MPKMPARWYLQSARRAYELQVDIDLLGGFVVQARWRGLYTRKHGAKQWSAISWTQTKQLLRELLLRRKRHGYQPLNTQQHQQASTPAPRPQLWVAPAAKPSRPPLPKPLQPAQLSFVLT